MREINDHSRRKSRQGGKGSGHGLVAIPDLTLPHSQLGSMGFLTRHGAVPDPWVFDLGVGDRCGKKTHEAKKNQRVKNSNYGKTNHGRGRVKEKGRSQRLDNPFILLRGHKKNRKTCVILWFVLIFINEGSTVNLRKGGCI